MNTQGHHPRIALVTSHRATCSTPAPELGHVSYADPMSVDTPEQLEGLRRAGRVVAATLSALRDAVAPGVTTSKLDRVAADVFAAHGARSGPILTYRYPGSVCLSVEDEIVHGVPGQRRLRAGQLITLDVAAELGGYHAGAAIMSTARHFG